MKMRVGVMDGSVAASLGSTGRASDDVMSAEHLDLENCMRSFVHAVSPELESKWRTEAERFYPEIRGRIVPADIFDEALRLLDAYRSGNTTK